MFRVGDRVKVVALAEEGAGYQIGDEFVITGVSAASDKDDAPILYEAEHGSYIFCDWELEIADSEKDVSIEEFNAKVKEAFAEEAVEENTDVIQRPSHYAKGNLETIEIIAEIIGNYDEPFVAHCVATATKYLSRAPLKHATPTEDLRKARRYLDFAIERLEGKR